MSVLMFPMAPIVLSLQRAKMFCRGSEKKPVMNACALMKTNYVGMDHENGEKPIQNYYKK